MADITFFYNPMSRAQIARWALHEVGADYDAVFVDWANKPQALLDANPMGKLPTIIHHHGGHDHVVTEAAAICHYLALVYPLCNLSPQDDEQADYFRWLFFASGPVEAAITAKSQGFDSGGDSRKEMTVGWGSYARVMDALDAWLSTHDYVCGPRFTMADAYLGSQVDWGLMFKTFEARDSFTAYAERLRARPAYQAAKAIDNALIAEMQGG